MSVHILRRKSFISDEVYVHLLSHVEFFQAGLYFKTVCVIAVFGEQQTTHLLKCFGGRHVCKEE